LLIAFAVFGIGLSLAMRYHWLSLLFLLPHTATASVILWLARSNRRTAAIACSACYFGLWLMTGIIGTRYVHGHLDQKFAATRVYYNGKLTSLRPMSYDPMSANERTPRGAWYFAGQPSSPCPFLVTVRYSWEAGCMYDYGESYYLWFCGAKRKVGAHYACKTYSTYPE
jgi:hypothetical protein